MFPGLYPGQPVTSGYLGQRLMRLGVDTRPARSAALLDMCAQLPPPVTAALLGISADTAAAWSGPSPRYAAELAARAVSSTSPVTRPS